MKIFESPLLDWRHTVELNQAEGGRTKAQDRAQLEGEEYQHDQ